MLARLRKAKENGESGFTLIELLVVMIIIGILAAIAIPAFLSQKNKAKETSAKSDAANIYKEFAAIAVDGDLTAASLPATTGGYTVTATPSGGTQQTAFVKTSAGNTATLGTATLPAVCVVVTPAGGASAWSAGPSGVFKGNTCS